MDIRIGVTDNPRELHVELPDDVDRAAVRDAADAALRGDAPSFWVTDAKGREFGVAAARIAYIELEPEGAAKTIGFS